MRDIAIPQFGKMLGIRADRPFRVFNDKTRNLVLLAKCQSNKRFALVLTRTTWRLARFGEFVRVCGDETSDPVDVEIAASQLTG